MPQQWNGQLVEQLATDFPRRKEPNFALANILSTFTLIPRIRGSWCVSTDEENNLYDHSGQSRTLAPAASPPTVNFAAGITPYSDFIAASQQYWTRNTEPGLEIVSYLTLWAWIRFHTSMTGASDWFLSKYGGAGNRGYLLYKTTGDALVLVVSTDGTASTSVSITSGTYGYAINKWFFVAGVYYPSTFMRIYVGDTETGKLNMEENTTSIPASIHPTLSPFQVGCYLSGSNCHDGNMSLFGVAAYPLGQPAIFNMFHQSRHLFMW